MEKTIYLIPGFKESINQKRYKELIKLFNAKGFEIIPIKISWNHHTMSDYVKEFIGQLKVSKKEVYFLGFSFGAMISLISSTKINPKAQIICSLSPYFKEDLPLLKSEWKNMIGKRRVKDLENFSFNELAEQVKCNTIIIAGGQECKEYPSLEKRALEAEMRIKNSKLIISEGAKHDISQEEYIKTIKELIPLL